VGARDGAVRAAVLGLVLVAAVARAQVPDPSFGLGRLPLDPSGEGTLLSGAGRIAAPGALRLVVAGELQHRPLLVPGRDESAAIVADRLALRVLASYGFRGGFDVTASLPGVARQGGEDLSRLGYVPAEAAGFADPALGLRRELTRRESVFGLSGFGLAGRLGLKLPLGSTGLGDGDRGRRVQLAPGVEAGAAKGAIQIAVDAGFVLAPLDSSRPARELTVQAAVQLTSQTFRPELTLRAIMPFDGSPGAEALLGASHLLGASMRLFALAGAGVGELAGLPRLRALVGLAWQPSLEAQVVERVVVQERVVEKVAAEAAEPDPCAPGQRHSFDQCPDLDDDGDGVANRADRCPVERGQYSNDGCPLPDRDRDEVPDVDDECVDSAGPAENLGCPVPDGDADGVADVVDNCPDAPGPAANHGCPATEPQRVYIVRETARQIRSRLKLSAGILFASGDAQISPESRPVLDQLAQLLARHPELTYLRVEGHTDAEGSPERNLELSQARAEEVLDYLRRRGVQRHRLGAKGFGATRPIDTGAAPAGRARNRRVELVSIDERGGN